MLLTWDTIRYSVYTLAPLRLCFIIILGYTSALFSAVYISLIVTSTDSDVCVTQAHFSQVIEKATIMSKSSPGV